MIYLHTCVDCEGERRLEQLTVPNGRCKGCAKRRTMTAKRVLTLRDIIHDTGALVARLRSLLSTGGVCVAELRQALDQVEDTYAALVNEMMAALLVGEENSRPGVSIGIREGELKRSA